MRKCYTEKLPKKKGFGKNQDKMIIDWGNSIGKTIPFCYEEIEGELLITDYHKKTQRITVSYGKQEYEMATSLILSCSLGSVVGKFNTDYIYDIDEVIELNGYGKVIDKLRKGKDNARHYVVKCLQCNNTYVRSESHLRDRGAKCPVCSDGISYPTKFVVSFLNQLKVEYQREFKIEGINDKRYDFYLPKYNCIIEVHGIQHYNGSFERIGGRTLQEEQENDRIKRELALEKEIKYYIELDCRESNKDWILDSIKNSELSILLNLSQIDWNECDSFAHKTITYDICNKFNSLYNKENSSITHYLANEFGIDRATVVKHLKKGAKLGWCNYDPQLIQKANGRSKGKLKSKPVVCIETGQRFESASECARVSEAIFGVKLLQSKINNVCNGVAKQHKGYTFMYDKGGV